jgi:hypothetical protein
VRRDFLNLFLRSFYIPDRRLETTKKHELMLMLALLHVLAASLATGSRSRSLKARCSRISVLLPGLKINPRSQSGGLSKSMGCQKACPSGRSDIKSTQASEDDVIASHL